MKKLLGVVALGSLWCNVVFAGNLPVDYKVKILKDSSSSNAYLVDAYIKIVTNKYLATLNWYIDGECSTFQKHSSGYFDNYKVILTEDSYLSKASIYITKKTYKADKVICLLDVDDIDYETRKLLQLD